MQIQSLVRVAVVSLAAVSAGCGASADRDESLGQVSLAVATITTDKGAYTSFEPITVTFGDVPPSTSTWFTMAPAGSADTQWVNYRWNDGSAAGTFQFAPPAPGTYVVRVLINATYQLLVESAPFTVAQGMSTATVDAPAVVDTPTFNITFAGFPPTPRDWIAIAPPGTPATSLHLSPQYTPGTASGTMTFPTPAAPGTYELRAFFNWDAVATRYTIQASDTFTVLGAGKVSRVSVASDGSEANAGGSIGSFFGALSGSANGAQFATFASDATNLVSGDTNGRGDIFHRNRTTGTTTRVNIGPGGAQADGGTDKPRISGDGRYVVFHSRATNLTAISDPSFNIDVFLHDTQTGVTELISVSTTGGPGDADSTYPSISDDGRYVAFGSTSTNLVPGDTNAQSDMFVRDRTAGTTFRASVGSFGEQANGQSRLGRVSANGAYVVFASNAPGLVPSKTSTAMDVFVRSLTSASTELITIATSGEANGDSDGLPEISSNGLAVIFRSWSNNLVAGDTNNVPDIFVRDRSTNITRRVSVGPSGAQADIASDTEGYGISDNNRYAVFSSDATTLVAGDTNGVGDVFVHDIFTATTTRVSDDGAGNQGNGRSWRPLLTSDGTRVIFESAASNLVPGDTNGRSDVFVRVLP